MAQDPGATLPPESVHFFVTCLVDQFHPEAGEAAVAVLEDAGCVVRFDPRQTCCGQPALNLGHLDEARAVARRLLLHHQDTTGPIVVPSGSCATTMGILYPRLFAGTPDFEEAARFASRVQEWSRHLMARDYHPVARRRTAPVTLHPACHGLRELGLTDEAKTLLARAQVPLVPLPSSEECCGFGGAFSVLLPEMSGRILAAKLDQIERAQEAGAKRVASLDVGCLMHMGGGHERRKGCPTGSGGCPRYAHVAEVLAEAIGAASPPDETDPEDG